MYLKVKLNIFTSEFATQEISLDNHLSQLMIGTKIGFNFKVCLSKEKYK